MLAQILKHTPTWVFVLFFGLVILGYMQSRTRRVSFVRLASVPIVLGAFSAYGVYSAFGTGAIGIANWSIGILSAILLNRIWKQPRGVTFAAADRVFVVPGSWIPFALMMTMFFTRYAVTVALTRDTTLAGNAVFVAAVCIFYGLLSGTFFARASRSYRAASEPKAGRQAFPMAQK